MTAVSLRVYVTLKEDTDADRTSLTWLASDALVSSHLQFVKSPPLLESQPQAAKLWLITRGVSITLILPGLFMLLPHCPDDPYATLELDQPRVQQRSRTTTSLAGEGLRTFLLRLRDCSCFRRFDSRSALTSVFEPIGCGTEILVETATLG